jgi:hypothetical protein
MAAFKKKNQLILSFYFKKIKQNKLRLTYKANIFFFFFKNYKHTHIKNKIFFFFSFLFIFFNIFFHS